MLPGERRIHVGVVVFYRLKVYAELEQNHVMEVPKACPSGGRGGGEGKQACKSTSFKVVEGSRVCIDFQEIRVQEQARRSAAWRGAAATVSPRAGPGARDGVHPAVHHRRARERPR